MRLGVLLPTFSSTPAAALDAAARAEAAGLDGVFAYDHVWPIRSPGRPAIAPFEVLATVAVRHPGLVVGPLVARVGLVADEVLLGQLRALRVVAAGRLVAALGTGDKLSREENLAYGIDFAAPAERRASMRAIAAALHAEGTEVWIGAGAAETNAVASELGCTLNLWGTGADRVAAAARDARVSWAGPAPRVDGAVDDASVAVLLDDLDHAGATWAVLGSSTTIELLGRRRARG